MISKSKSNNSESRLPSLNKTLQSNILFSDICCGNSIVSILVVETL